MIEFAPAAIPFSGAAEGTLDGAVVQRVAADSGIEVATIFGQRGVSDLIASLKGYNASAAHMPWIVLFDLDAATCAPDLLRRVIPIRSRFMCCRIAVRMVEAWLLADGERLATWLSAPRGLIPAAPETISSPKAAMVAIARASRSSVIRNEMVPAAGAIRSTGTAYNARLIAFVSDRERGWRPSIARASANSLDRAIRCLEGQATAYQDYLREAATDSS